MKRFGLIGEKLSHSYSQTLHGLLGDDDYSLWPMPPEALAGFMNARAFDGVNVTIPYKRAVIPYLQELSATARRVGSVNTVVKRADGSLFGDNTDAYGFAEMARRAGVDFADGKTLVLGSGATAMTVCDVVSQAGGEPVVVSRGGPVGYDRLEEHAVAKWLVNTTPVGMYPNAPEAAVELTKLPKLRGVLDVIYNPMNTRLLQQARERGLTHAGGLSMLVYQAVRARELFTDAPVTPERAKNAEEALRRSAMNFVLVGMPGCGKSTVGRALSKRTGMPAIDIDIEIEREAGMSIPDLFAKEGESGFRARETALIARYGRESGRVLITGGGAVKDEANREALRLNGFVAHITRELALLDRRARPLSSGPEAVDRLWEERAPLYAACADAVVPNNATPEICARAVEEAARAGSCR